MSSLKTIAACLGILTATAFGLTSTSPKDESGQDAKSSPEKGSETAKRTPPPQFAQRADYVVEPPDLIDLWVEKTLAGRPITGERLVRPDGTMSIGWYGDLDVAGLTVAEIKKKLITKLQTFLSDESLGLVAVSPSGETIIDPATGAPKRIDPKDSKKVRVAVTQCNSKCFYVQGEVRSPGSFRLTDTLTVQGAITAAGGLSPVADPAKVLVFRENSRGEPERIAMDANLISHGKPLSASFLVKRGDRVVVHRRAGAAAEARANSAQQLNGGSEEPAMHRLEKRMSELEQKLDRILEAIKRRGS